MRNRSNLTSLEKAVELERKHGWPSSSVDIKMIDAFGPDHDWYFFRPLLQEMMNKTKIQPSEVAQKAIDKARSMIGKGIVYKLGAGGRNPNNKLPYTYRDGVLGCDCAGFVAWTCGFDRFQDWNLFRAKRPGQFSPNTSPEGYNNFNYYGGWINTDSMLEDAFDNNADWFTALSEPIPGAIICYSSTGKGKDRRIGHEGLIVEAPLIFDREDPESWKKLKVIDCRSAKPAILERDAMAWFGKDRKGRPKNSQFIWPNFVFGPSGESTL